MVNTNIQASIPLAGRGFTFKRKGNYAPGEYPEFSNVVLNNEGVIQNRPNILATGALDGGTFMITNPGEFIGSISEWSIIASATEQFAVNADHNVTCWAPTSLPVGTGLSYHKIIGVFKYNDRIHWITYEFDEPSTTYKIHLYYSATANALTPVGDIAFADLTDTVVLAIVSPTPVTLTNFFVYKERLWIATDTTVYFSKATDPLVFDVPLGGFFKVPDQQIKYTFPLSDTIYVLCENTVFVLTYSVDVNEDGYLRMVSSNLGAEWGCVHQGNPVFVNKFGIYSLINNNLELLIETDFDGKTNSYQNKLVSFENNLFLLRRSHVAYKDGLAWGNDTGKYYDRTASINGYNIFSIDTNNSTISVWDYTDQRDLNPSPGYVVDIMVNPYKDFFGNYHMMFLTNRFVSDVAGVRTYRGSTYLTNPESDTLIFDQARDSAGIVLTYKPRILIEIDSFVPDGNEYFMKKFRSLFVMAKFPSRDFGISVAYGDLDYGDNRPALDVEGLHPHHPHRYALNQRAHAISIRLETTDDLPILTPYDQLEISQMLLFWTYTQRANKYSNPSLQG